MAMLTSEIIAFIKKTRLGFVATVCPDGTPNLSPKGTVTGWDDSHLVFADIHSPGTVNNVLTNPAIEVNVVDIFSRKGYRFKGTGKVLADGSMFEEILAFYKDAGSRYTINNIVLIKVDQVIEITSPIYDTGATEEEVITRWKDYWNTIY